MYEKEPCFLKEVLKKAYENCIQNEIFVSKKAEFDIVTNVDHAIERYVSEEIKRSFPSDLLHGEESHPDCRLSDRLWILDPIDGTFNFSTESPHFGVQAAFWDQGAVQVSVIYLPKFDELYEAKRGCGAFCNGKRLSVSHRSVEKSIVSFGDFPHSRPDDVLDQKKLMDRALEKISKVRMFGAASIDFCYLASGKTEGVVLFTKNKWDIAPGWLLAQEAGAWSYSLDGSPYSFDSRGILSFHNEELHQVMTKGVF